jgi:hypothetical protein
MTTAHLLHAARRTVGVALTKVVGVGLAAAEMVTMRPQRPLRKRQ